MIARQTERRQGFVLIELAIGVLIISIVAGALLTWVTWAIEKKAFADTTDKIAKIEDALVRYYGINGYLPCAASRTVAQNNVSFGVATDCTVNGVAGTTDSATYATADSVRYGMVPTRTLGLPDSYAIDAFGNRIRYVVIRTLAVSQSLYTNYTTLAINGVIKVTDASGNQIPQFSAAVTNDAVAYAVISHGQDPRGAYTNVGVAFGKACGGTLDSTNCTDAVSPATPTVIDAPMNYNTTTPANYFDDFVAWKTRTYLIQAARSIANLTPPSLKYTGVGRAASVTPVSRGYGTYYWYTDLTPRGDTTMFLHDAVNGDQMVVPAGVTKVRIDVLYQAFLPTCNSYLATVVNILVAGVNMGDAGVQTARTTPGVIDQYNSYTTGVLNVVPGESFRLGYAVWNIDLPGFACNVTLAEASATMHILECTNGCTNKQ